MIDLTKKIPNPPNPIWPILAGLVTVGWIFAPALFTSMDVGVWTVWATVAMVLVLTFGIVIRLYAEARSKWRIEVYRILGVILDDTDPNKTPPDPLS